MTSRGKQSRALSPKKVSRRKRTPRCDCCGKAEGEQRVGGDESGSKVRLKLCARCRKVTYCGTDCQRLAWRRHREVCAHSAIPAAELPAPSPLLNHNKLGGAGPRGRRKIPAPTSASSRQRENAPTKHPFFGREESTGSQASNSVVPSVPTQSYAPPASVGRAKTGSATAGSARDTEQGQDSSLHSQEEAVGVEDSGSPSPPKMERLSMTRRASGNRSREARLSNGSAGGSTKRSPTSSGSRQKSAVGAALAAALGATVPMSPVGENRSRVASPTLRRWGSSPAGARILWGTHKAQNGAASRGNASPPPVLGRRESAPPYPAALKNKHRASGGRAFVSAAPASTRGPPPPYALVAHRAGSLRRHSSSGPLMKGVAASGAPGDAGDAAPPTAAAKAVRVAPAEATLPPPSLRPSSETPGAAIPPPPPGPQKFSRPGVAESSANAVGYGETAERGGALKIPLKDPTPRQHEDSWTKDPLAVTRDTPEAEDELVGIAVIQEGAPFAKRERVVVASPVENLPIESMEEVPNALEATVGYGPAGAGVDTPPCSTGVDEEIEAMVDTGSAVTARQPEQEGEEEREKEEESADPRAGSSIPHPDKMCGEAQEREVRGITRRASGSDRSEISADSAGEGLPSSAEDEDVFQMAEHTEPSPLILPILKVRTSSTRSKSSTRAKSSTSVKRAKFGGIGDAFDSCPPSAGVPGFADERKSATKEPPQRSFSVDTVPQTSAFPLAAKVKEMVAATTGWTRGRSGRRNSPRPRPPGSPGPAALSDGPPSKSSSAWRARITSADGDGATAPSSSKSSSGIVSPWVRSASFLPSGLAAPDSSGTGLTPSKGAAATRGWCSPSSPPFVPVVEMSPATKAPTPHRPGPRVTETAAFYQIRSTALDALCLPPPSKAYLGRPAGFSVHVLVASASCPDDLPVTGRGSPETASDENAAAPGWGRQARTGKAQVMGSVSGNPRRTYYSFADRGQVARALQPGDVVLLAPGRYEARAWGLQRLVSSVEIIGAGDARACVVYNDPAEFSTPQREHYLVGVMGGGAIGGRSGYGGGCGGGCGAVAVKGSDNIDDDSDSGWEDGKIGSRARGRRSFNNRAVRIRLANLTLEQGSGHRGAIYQLGRDSHLELDGCNVRCSRGGVNVDQGTCLICDTVISGSEVFGVHIGGDGAVEHCSISDCGRGSRRGAGAGEGEGDGRAKADGSVPCDVTDSQLEDDGTDVNRMAGMPAISVLQSSRVRVRFNLIHDNVGHSLQLRDAPLPGGDDNHAVQARLAEAEAEEKLRSWLGAAAALLREHLQGKHREGFIVAQGNHCHCNRGCEVADCDGRNKGAKGTQGVDVAPHSVAAEEATRAAGGKGLAQDLDGGGGGSSFGGSSFGSAGGSQVCIPTAEEEGLPLPAAATMRFLAAMDEGYVGSMREENSRARRRAALGGTG